MNKLQQVLQWLDISQVHATQSYLLFHSKTGEPQTVCVNEQEQLVVSGIVPGQLYSFTNPVDCAKYIAGIAPTSLLRPEVTFT